MCYSSEDFLSFEDHKHLLVYCRIVWGKDKEYKSAGKQEVGLLKILKTAGLVILKSSVQSRQILWLTGSKVHSPSLSIIIKQSPFLWAGYRKVTMIVTGLPDERWKAAAEIPHQRIG